MSEHPKDRPAEPRDPLHMFADGVAGDPGLMLDCIVEEYSRMGLDANEIIQLFENPQFLATHGLRGHFGPSETGERVRRVLSRCGVLRVRTSAVPSCDSFNCSGS